jgi:putative tryptophan/tyrosine transport system substrate-binding protein
MQGQHAHARKTCQFLILLWLWLLPMTGSGNDNTVLIIKSNENSFFNQSIEKLINMSNHKVKFNIINAEIYEKKPQTYHPDVIITLGYRAAQLTKSIEHKTPVIHSYITDFQLSSHGRHYTHYSVLLDQPIERYFRFIKLLLSVDKVGLIKTKSNKLSQKRIHQLEKSTALEIDQFIFNAGDNPITSVRNILQVDDVLLSLPEPSIYNHQTLKGILLASYRLNKPVISYSPAHVNSGALAAIYTSPAQIGKQVAEILNKLLDGELTSKDSVIFAHDFKIKINRQVAHSLQIKLPSDTEIMDQLLLGEAK